MGAYLTRLISALGAYQIASILQRVLAVLLLPVYTGKIPPSGYGIVEALVTFVIFVSILVRLGLIESFLRFYFTDTDPQRRAALVRTCVFVVLASSTVACVVLAIPAGPLSQLVTGEHVPAAFRVSVLGIWAFTNLELALATLRVDERLRAYVVCGLTNVTLTVAGSVVLVVFVGDGYMGLLIANYCATAVVLLGLWWTMRRRLSTGPGAASSKVAGAARDHLRTLLDFGLPTVPAEASVYALNVIDRQFIIHQDGAASAGRYAIAIKVAGVIVFIVQAFQYAFPPLAYSVTDDAQAARLYGLVTTYYSLLTGWAVAVVTLEGRYIIRFLAPHAGYYGAFKAIPWVSLGWALSGLWVVLLVIAGRANVTRRNFPAALVGLVVNVGLLALLVPPLGIVGGGIALCGAYVAMLGVMHLLVRKAFAVTFEWGRLTHLVLIIAGMTVLGDLLLPTSGVVGLIARAAVIVLIPLTLWATGFAHSGEIQQGRAVLASAARRLGLQST